MDRRWFLKVLGAAGSATLIPKQLAASTTDASEIPGASGHDPMGVLVDTTQCAGCRSCEEICAETNNLPMPDTDDESVFDGKRTTSDTQWSVMTRFDTDIGEVYVKRQCMHCLSPACASACLTKAMHKSDEGPVVWDSNKCMGCRFCMISCPFDMPKFEYHSANPKIQKCRLCLDRQKEGEIPACVENCPAEALTFGRRSELIREARSRIVKNPDEYVDHIYGEREVGGTNWLYLAGVPFDQLGFRTDLGEESYPKLSADFLYAVPIVLTLWPPLLYALNRATDKEAPEEITEEVNHDDARVVPGA